MAIPAGLFKCTFNWQIGDSEIAQFGMYGHWLLDPIDDGDIQDLADKYVTVWNTEMGPRKSLFSTAVKGDFVRVVVLDNTPGPRFLKETDNVAESSLAGYVGTATESLPWETSLAVSLAAYPPGAHRLRAGRLRGRFYLPPTSPGLIDGDTGEISTAQLGSLADGIHDFIESMNDDLNGAQYHHVILSRGGTEDPVDPAFITPIEQMWIDSIYDSQRRRRNRQTARSRQVRTFDA